MYENALHKETRQVLEKLLSFGFVKNFYLAGGTALALHLGHRKSVDLDFFIHSFPDKQLLIQQLQPLNPTIAQESQGTIDLIIQKIKISFLEYSYPLLDEFVEYSVGHHSINLAAVTDIACMKLTAISSRGSKKDFVDIYTILQNTTLAELFKQFERKYKGVRYSKTHLLKSLVYFDDAEEDPQPEYMCDCNWEDVKTFLRMKVKDLSVMI